MPIEINKLTLEVPRDAANHPEDLGERVARQLARMQLSIANLELAGISISVSRASGENDDSLAERIANQLLRQLNALT